MSVPWQEAAAYICIGIVIGGASMSIAIHLIDRSITRRIR